MSFLIIFLILIGLILGVIISNLRAKKSAKDDILDHFEKPDPPVHPERQEDKYYTSQNMPLIIDNKPFLKQFGDLTQSDFDQYPVWISCHSEDNNQEWYDDTDEETFRPWTGNIPVSPDYGMFLVKADFQLKNGEMLPGFITPCLKSECLNEDDLGIIQPQVFLENGGLLGFWAGMFPIDKVALKNAYQLLNNTGDQVFPITFNATQGLSNEVNSGQINGFLTSVEDRKIVVTR